jgi:elongation factor G
MDKEGCNFGLAIDSLRRKLPGANPIPIQLPLFRSSGKAQSSSRFPYNVVALPIDDSSFGGGTSGEFVGVVDLVHMRAILWHDSDSVANVESCIPDVIPLLQPVTRAPIDPDCSVTEEAINARASLIEQLADCDEQIEDLFLSEQEPNNVELRLALRRATLAHKVLPVMTAAALRGKGVEPVIDAIADLLPSPLDRNAPALLNLDDINSSKDSKDAKRGGPQGGITFGHPLHPSLLALAFKVVHMKGRGGSGDGRVVFARVYSGELRDRDTISVIAPPPPGEIAEKPRLERVGGMLELAGGRFGNLEEGICRSGDVCAIVGLKTVKTGDTIFSAPDRSKAKKKQQTESGIFCLAGVAPPKPVLKVRLEVETTEQQTRLSEALALLTVEDPSLVVETGSSTLLSGLGELHIEVTLDRLKREFGLEVRAGAPFVAYRETIIEDIETAGLCNYDKTVGGTRMQAAVHLMLEPTWSSVSDNGSRCMMIAEPTVSVSDTVRTFLGLDLDSTDEKLLLRSHIFKALVQGCQGALKRGPVGQYAMVNLKCQVIAVDAEGGLTGLLAMPGALRAAAANAVFTTLSENRGLCNILEPTMSIEVSLPNDMVGTVLSDLTSRRGHVEDVFVGDSEGLTDSKALIRGEVPLVEILGYANNLRSLTGGEGEFTAEYRGHSSSNVAM